MTYYISKQSWAWEETQTDKQEQPSPAQASSLPQAIFNYAIIYSQIMFPSLFNNNAEK